MEPVHTIVFLLNNDIQLPVKKDLFPLSARFIQILTNPTKYGWKQDNDIPGICIINMKNMGISPSTILTFLNIIQTEEISAEISQSEINNLERFAILIDMGSDDCIFKQAVNKYKNDKNKLDYDPNNPMSPIEDKYEKYNWTIMSAPGASDCSDDWSVTIRGSGPHSLTDYFYWRRKKTE